jgi:UDP:flavonoid glycosyltransferase YjiC (YdhE family)
MAKFLFTWEFGGGLGHVTRIAAIASRLADRGHQVWFASREIGAAHKFLRGTGVRILPAPIQNVRAEPGKTNIGSFPELLCRNGISNPHVLECLVHSWRAILNLIRPDVTVCDYSPSAMAALVGWPCGKVEVGTGFLCPPVDGPIPPFYRLNDRDEDRLAVANADLKSALNTVFDRLGQPPISEVNDLFSQVDKTYLATYPELDHYGPRIGKRYAGILTEEDGVSPDWPEGSGPRIFGYLKPFSALEALLKWLAESQNPTLIYAPQVSDELKRTYASETLRFASQPLSLREVAETANLAILNGTHGATASMLLYGVPVLSIPLASEQAITATNVRRMGAGLFAGASDEDAVIRGVQEIIATDQYRVVAEKFRQKYGAHAIGNVCTAICNELEELAISKGNDRERAVDQAFAATLEEALAGA